VAHEYKIFLNKYSNKIELNNAICNAILELLKKKIIKNVLIKKYNGLNKQINYICKLLDVLVENKDSLTTLIISIEKELIKYSKLNNSIETNGFFLLKRLFKVVYKFVDKNFKQNEQDIKFLNVLYQILDISNIIKEKQIELGCYYIEFIMQSNQRQKIKKFKEFIKENPKYKSLFQNVIINKDRILCEDGVGFGIVEDRVKKEIWEELKLILEVKN